MNMRCDTCRREVEFTRENSTLYWYVLDWQYNHVRHVCKCGGLLLNYVTPTAEFWENIPKLIEGGWSIKVSGEAPDDVKNCLDTTNARDEADKATLSIFNRTMGDTRGDNDPLD